MAFLSNYVCNVASQRCDSSPEEVCSSQSGNLGTKLKEAEVACLLAFFLTPFKWHLIETLTP